MSTSGTDTASAVATSATVVIEKRIATGSDDVEQRGSKMSLGDSDLELVADGSTIQNVGARFTALNIPVGAIITSAYIQFQTDEVGTAPASLLIRGLASDDAAAFTSKTNNLTSRPTTAGSVAWQPSAWTVVHEAGAAQRTPDLAALVQEIVSRAGWQPGNDMAFRLSGSGTRTALAYESGSASAPLLHVEYVLPLTNAAPTLDLDGSAAGTDFATILTKTGSPVPIADADAAITDPDDEQMERLTVSLTNAKPGDQLTVGGTLPAGIAVESATAATVILSGSASIAAYQAALRQILFGNALADPDPTARTIQVAVNDGQATSSAAVATVAIQNQAPVLDLDASATGTGYSAVFVARGGGVPIADGDALISDPDDVEMTGLSVQITNAQANDQLIVNGTLPSGITVDPASTATALTLIGSASTAAYQSAVQQVRFTNSSASPNLTGRQVQVIVNDGQAISSPAVAQISVSAGNVAPILDLDASSPGTGYSAVYSLNGPGVAIADIDLGITDPDDVNMERLTATLLSPKTGDQLVVSGTLPGGILVDPASTQSTLVLTGSASIAAYASALRRIQFSNADPDLDPATREIQVTADDGQAISNAAIAAIQISAGNRILEQRILAGADDVEQRGSAMSLTSSDLELVVDGTTVQTVGLRFANIGIPAGAVITKAYVQFQTDEVSTAANSLKLFGLATDDLAPFTTASNDLTSRAKTTGFVSWDAAAWTLVGDAGADQRTPDLTSVLQEIVGRGGWQPGNDLGFLISGSGTRTAHAFESSPVRAPLLHVEYLGPPPTPSTITLTGNYGYSEYRVGGLIANSVIDATSASWIVANSRNPNPDANTPASSGTGQLNTYPFQMDSAGSGLLIRGGVIWGEVPQASDWAYTYNNSAALRIEEAPNVIIDDWRIDRAWDAIRLINGSSNFLIDDAHISSVRDDAIENDYVIGGTIRDSLLDGVFSGISLGDGDNYNGSMNTITLEGLFMRSKSYLYQEQVTHVSPFKTNTNAPATTPDIRIINSVIAIEDPNHHGQERLRLAWDNVVESSGNLFLNLSDTPLASAYPMPPAGFTILQGQQARDYWEAVKAAWLDNHDGTPYADVTPLPPIPSDPVVSNAVDYLV